MKSSNTNQYWQNRWKTLRASVTAIHDDVLHTILKIILPRTKRGGTRLSLSDLQAMVQTLNDRFKPKKHVPEGIVQDLTTESVFADFADGFDLCFVAVREVMADIRLSVEKTMRAAAEAAAATAAATAATASASAQNNGGQAAP